MKKGQSWTRTDKWTAAGVIVGILFGLVSLFVPEVRRKLGLERPHPLRPAAVLPTTTSQQVVNSAVGNKNIARDNTAGNNNVVGHGNQVTKSVGATANAPNGIAITGGTVTNPTVNNNYAPPPPPPAVISVCASSSTPDNSGKVVQVFTLRTDARVEGPQYDFQFSSVLPKDTWASSPDMGMNTSEGRSDSRYSLRLNQTWYPDQRINIVVDSGSQPVQLATLSGRNGERFVRSSGNCRSGL